MRYIILTVLLGASVCLASQRPPLLKPRSRDSRLDTLSGPFRIARRGALCPAGTLQWPSVSIS